VLDPRDGLRRPGVADCPSSDLITPAVGDTAYVGARPRPDTSSVGTEIVGTANPSARSPGSPDEDLGRAERSRLLERRRRKTEARRRQRRRREKPGLATEGLTMAEMAQRILEREIASGRLAPQPTTDDLLRVQTILRRSRERRATVFGDQSSRESKRSRRSN
jgi:hypothetical protein